MLVRKNKKYPDHASLKKANSNFVNNMPERWDSDLYDSIRKKFIFVLSYIPVKCKLLDIGCNSGEMGRMIKSVNKCDVYGIDINRKLVKIAKGKIKAKYGDAEKIPFPDNTFDCVFLGEMLEHTYKPDLVLKGIKRVLKPEGLLLGTTINEEYMFKTSGWEWDDERCHARTYNSESMGKLIAKQFRFVNIFNVKTANTWMWIIFKGRK